MGKSDVNMWTRGKKLALACVIAGIIAAVAAVIAVTGPQPTKQGSTPERDLIPQTYFGTWNNVRKGGYSKVIITGNPAKPRVHIWGSCSPEDCDIGEEDGLWDGSALGVSFKPQLTSTSILSDLTTFRLTMEGTDSLKLNCHSPWNLWHPFTNNECVTMFYTRTP